MGKLAAIFVAVLCLAFMAGYLVRYGRGADAGGRGSGSARARAPAPGGPAERSESGEAAEEVEGEPEREAASDAPEPGARAGEPAGGVETPAGGSSDEVPTGGVGPRIEFESDTFDFGTLYQREEVKHEFAFRNVGDARLKIADVKSTCGCAPVVLSEREIAPGDGGRIEVTVQAGLLKGELTKYVYVDSNDASQPRAKLKITGEIRQEVEVKPGGLYVGRVAAGSAVERTVEISLVEGEDFTVLGATATHAAVQVGEPVRMPGEGVRYELGVRFGPVEEAGRVNAKMVVRTDLEHTPEIEIPLYGKIVAREAANAG